MIRSKSPVIINCQTSDQAIIYLNLVTWGQDEETGRFIIAIRAQIMENGVLKEISSDNITTDTYTESSFRSKFGGMTIDQICDSKDALVIQEIGLNSSKFWNLTSEDLEVYTPA